MSFAHTKSHKMCLFLLDIVFMLTIGEILCVGDELYQQQHRHQRRTSYITIDWCYGRSKLCGESVWDGVCKKGEFQSPINLPGNLGKLTANKGYFDSTINFPRSTFFLQGYQMEFTGRTLKIWPAHEEDTERLSFQWINHDEDIQYVFHSVHFHWGSVEDLGSEHTIDGRAYPGEMHIVFFDQRWGTMEQALTSKYRNTILVLAVFMNIGMTIPDEQDSVTSYFLHPVIRNLPALEQMTTFAEVSEWLNLAEALVGKYAYTYLGSLTTPKCNENVVWVIMRHPVTVPESHFVALRKTNFTGSGHLVNNYRTLQRKRKPDGSNDYSADVHLVNLEYN